MAIDGQKIKKILFRIAEVMNENKGYLSELDAAIGDGDHGLNMNKGFTAVVEKLKDDPCEDIGGMLKKTGMALVSNVGGASGPLYGTAFMRAGAFAAGKKEVDIRDFLNIMCAALEGIKMRGKAVQGEKTMIDALEPAVDSLRCAIEKEEASVEAIKIMLNAAEEGMMGTKDIPATKGRASYLGQRSIGHQDPGATSSYLIIKTIYEEMKR